MNPLNEIGKNSVIGRQDFVDTASPRWGAARLYADWLPLTKGARHWDIYKAPPSARRKHEFRLRNASM